MQPDNGMEFLANAANAKSGLSAPFLIILKSTVDPLKALPVRKTGDVSGTVSTFLGMKVYF